MALLMLRTAKGTNTTINTAQAHPGMPPCFAADEAATMAKIMCT